MSPAIATIAFAIGILGLFILDREKETKTSKALWIPTVWMLIIGSRPVSQWLDIAPPADSAAQLLDGSPIDRNVFSILLLAGLIVLVMRGQQVFGVLRRNGPMLLLFSYCLLSVLWSDYPEVAIKRWTKYLGDLMMVLIILTDPKPLGALKQLLSRLAFLLVPLSILFIKYYPDLGRSYSPWTGETAYTGVTINKQGLGMVVLILGLGALWQLVELYQARNIIHRRRHLIAQGVLLSMVIWLLYMAHSLSSTACFLMVGCMIAAIGLFRSCQKPGFIHSYVTAAVSLSILALFLKPDSGLIESMGRSVTLTGRTEIWSLVLSMPINRMIGAGFESFWTGQRLQHIWDVYWWHPIQAHNGYIEILLNLGWIGVILLSLFLIKGYRNITSGLRRHPERNSIKLAYFMVAVIYGFTEATFRMLSYTWIFLLLAVVAIVEPPIPEGQLSIQTGESHMNVESEPEYDRDLCVGRRLGSI